MAKSQQQQQVEKDAQRVVDLAQARMAAGILPAQSQYGEAPGAAGADHRIAPARPVD